MTETNPIKPRSMKREEHADAASIGAQLKELSSSRAAVAESTARLTPLFPIEGENEIEAYNVESLLEKTTKEIKERTEAEKAKENEIYTFFVKCRVPHPEGQPSHGVYLKSNPNRGVVGPNEWNSAYKPKHEAPWYEDVVCQVCLRYYGQRTTLPVSMVAGKPGSFTVEPRWLWRRPRDTKRAQIEGETRANELASPIQNQGRSEANARAAAAGYEVIP
mgnify:CR=1 FL=1